MALAQTAPQNKTQEQPAGELKLSPAKIGSGGRVERHFYRAWINRSKIAMAEGCAMLDAKNQPVEAWAEIGGRGLHLNFSGNAHLGAVMKEIPEGKAPAQTRHFYEQLTCVLARRGRTMFGEGVAAEKGRVGGGQSFRGSGECAASVLQRRRRALGPPAAHYVLPIDLANFRQHGPRSTIQRPVRRRSRLLQQRAAPAQALGQDQFVKNIRNSEVMDWPERGEGNAASSGTWPATPSWSRTCRHSRPAPTSSATGARTRHLS